MMRKILRRIIKEILWRQYLRDLKKFNDGLDSLAEEYSREKGKK